MPEKRLFLLDAMALIYRAYFALNKNPRINSKGLNTSAILGFANTLYDVLKKDKPSHIGVAFDTMAPTQRHTDFVEYKANRESMPEELAASLPYIMELIKAFNIPILTADGYEADDIIGTLSKQAEKQGFEVYMMTSDKDFGQLVSEKVFIYKPGRMGKGPEVWGVEEVCKRYGMQKPEQLIDILGMMGDASDNIPGIPGVGEKTAIKLLGEFGSMESLYENTDKLKGKLRENVESNKEKAFISRQLATIILDVPVEFNPDELFIEKPDEKLLKSLLEELEFKTFAKRVFTDLFVSEKEAKSEKEGTQTTLFDADEKAESVLEDNKKSIKDTAHEYHLVDDEKSRFLLLKHLKDQSEICFDTETTGLNPFECELVGIAFSWGKGEAYFLNLPIEREETQKILEPFKEVLENDAIAKIGQNMKYDILVLKQYSIEVRGALFDTMLAHYLLEPDLRHNMDYLAEHYLNYVPVSIKKLIGKKGKKQMSMRMVPLEDLSEYAGEDADITFQLKTLFEKEIKRNKISSLFEDVEMKLMPVLADIEEAGVKLDHEALFTISKKLGKDIAAIEEKVFDMAGTQFNIASPRQLGEVLFEKLKITDKPRRTKTKQYSTSEDVLVKLINKHPIVQKILDYRSLTKLKSTYVDALPLIVNKKTGLIHTSFNQAVAATGRLSSNNPNLQNIPVRTERGREIRKAFVPRDENHILLAADYSQIELRIIAALSQDEGMLEAFNMGLDIHAATAAKVYGVDLDKVDKEMRRKAKMVNFGIVYGISAFGLSERLTIPRREAADIIEQYFKKYPGIKSYMDECIQFAREHGYVETILKRRRYLRDIASSNNVVRGFAERNAINAPIQGSAADMIKLAMINIHRKMKEEKLKSKMILQVHDELVFDVLKEELESMQQFVPVLMKTAVEIDVPIEVDMNTGRNWLEAH